MSEQFVSTYSPEAIVAIIDGYQIEGFSEEGVTFEYPGESEVFEGMDSGMTIDFNPSRLVRVTLNLRAASAGARLLNEIRQACEDSVRNAEAYPVIQGIFADPINGSEVRGQVAFLNRPLAQFAMKSGTVSFTLAVMNVAHQIANNL